MNSNITELKHQINYYFHNTYLTKYPIVIQDMLIHLFNDGKRIRPILFIAFSHIADLSGVEKEDNIWIEYAIEIELLHCLSLVIDDLPEMDNEVERRGRQCFHLVYGLQKTNFFLYYMFSKLSSNLTNLFNYHNNKNHSIVSKRIFNDASFLVHYLINNLIDGQYIDITSNKSMSNDMQSLIDGNIILVMQVIMYIYDEDIEEHQGSFSMIIKNHIMLNIKKTGTLFALPIITGFLFQIYKKNLQYTGKEVILDEFYIPDTADTEDTEGTINACNSIVRKNKLDLGDDNIINLIITWALFLGFLFQTSDDFLDMETDASNGKPNICNIIGIEDSIKLLSKSIVIARVTFEYIVKNTLQIWPDLVINAIHINSVIDLIESRYQKEKK
jgi:geranylgeranyl pyrophosphate synthase